MKIPGAQPDVLFFKSGCCMVNLDFFLEKYDISKQIVPVANVYSNLDSEYTDPRAFFYPDKMIG